MSTEIPKSQFGDPAWEIATLFPSQGEWTEQEYLSLETNRMIELNDGKLEFLPMPTELHQLIAIYLFQQLFNAAAGAHPGLALIPPFRVRVSDKKFREPDVMFMLNKNRARRHSKYWDGADLVIEIVNDDDPCRDLVTKRTEYAQARISEYWIVDPRDHSVLVLTLDEGSDEYRESGRYTKGQTAQSVLLSGFQIKVDSVFDQPV